VRVLDLYAGMGGWSQPARDRGHDVTRVELDSRFDAEVHADVLTLTADDLGGRGAFDLVLASPPCEAWSVMRIGANWHPDVTPKTAQAAQSVALLDHTLRLISDLAPRFWVLENPRGMMRKHPLMAGLDRQTVTYCHYGEQRMKPTDLWSNAWPPSLVLAPACRNGDPCHVRAPRGSTTGTQGTKGERGGYWVKSIVPYPLASAVLDAAEHDMASGLVGSSQTLWEVNR